MTNHRYNTPEEGTLDWHIPLNENFEELDRDVEIRDTEDNRDAYPPQDGAKFLATDSGATFVGDGSNWNLVGYVARAGGGDLGHYVQYEAGLEEEEINSFVFGDDEMLEIVRASLPQKGESEDTIDSDVTLRVYEGGPDGNLLLEVQGNEFKTASADSSAPWVADSSPVSVTVSNNHDEAVNVVPKVWANIRQ